MVVCAGSWAFLVFPLNHSSLEKKVSANNGSVKKEDVYPRFDALGRLIAQLQVDLRLASKKVELVGLLQQRREKIYYPTLSKPVMDAIKTVVLRPKSLLSKLDSAAAGKMLFPTMNKVISFRVFTGNKCPVSHHVWCLLVKLRGSLSPFLKNYSLRCNSR